jgi:methyltransferase family protein
MPQSAFRYCVSHPVRAAYTFASAPLEALTAFQERYVATRERPVPPDLYKADCGWECRMHELLGAPQPCPATSEFWTLWAEVIGELKTKGIRVGPESFKGWNDGDAAFVRAIWCLTRHLRPSNVVETGVAHGVSSRFILEALERNGGGSHLWSIDHPPLEHVWHTQIGLAVGGRYPARWSYIRGSSKRRLPGLISQLGHIDLFVHDSLHSEHNVRFEMDRAWAALRPGGAMVVDDIDANWGFKSFEQAFSGHRSLICEAEPLHPDMRRFNQKGLFGIILKEPTATRGEK